MILHSKTYGHYSCSTCLIIYVQLAIQFTLPSVLWRCWLGGRKGIWPVKNWVVGCWHGYLSWLWSEVQTCIWPSWCHCHSLSLDSVKSRLVLPFWYRLTRVVPEKGPLNGCVCVWLFNSLGYWQCLHSMQSRVYVTVRCLSIYLSCWSSRGVALTQYSHWQPGYGNTGCSTVLSNKWGQCHVYS